ncbi:putative U-box domain-containing protein 33 isoform X1 [Iris pallida]|uniref:RING-type E3 ubiquitin transferase n=1 Tax=Iris pallida TaxID=29817 RepID=A0AAX6H222_IRIPA|nr:putative U-box domain-containing protein 33 isoform X1 [Iris pallida]
MGSKPAIFWSNVNVDLDWRGMDSANIEPLQPSDNNYKEKKRIENSRPPPEPKPTTGRIGSTSQRPSADTRVKPNFKPYSEEEIRDATNNFRESFIIGAGGYGAVYKCKLDDWDVAVKILGEKSDQGLTEYIKEMGVLSRMRHENLVHLMGTCFELRALIYEYIPNGSLEKCLEERPTELTWQLRTRIVYEICKGIMYLHAKQPQALVHGDLKPHNVLLDDGFRVKLADFGLCRVLTQGQASKAHHLTLTISGSTGYMDPDYIATGKVTPVVDVYALGKTVMRVLTGQQPLDVFAQVHAANKRGSLMKIVDPTVRDWPKNVVEVLARFALKSCKLDRYKPEFFKKFYSDIGKILDDIGY